MQNKNKTRERNKRAFTKNKAEGKIRERERELNEVILLTRDGHKGSEGVQVDKEAT